MRERIIPPLLQDKEHRSECGAVCPPGCVCWSSLAEAPPVTSLLSNGLRFTFSVGVRLARLAGAVCGHGLEISSLITVSVVTCVVCGGESVRCVSVLCSSNPVLSEEGGGRLLARDM